MVGLLSSELLPAKAMTTITEKENHGPRCRLIPYGRVADDLLCP